MASPPFPEANHPPLPSPPPPPPRRMQSSLRPKTSAVLHSLFDIEPFSPGASPPVRRSRRLIDGTLPPDSSRGGAVRTHTPVPPTERNALNLYSQCFFCRQGGCVFTCSTCLNIAGCVRRGGYDDACFPWCEKWICPDCYVRSGQPIPYPAPSLSSGGSRAGISSAALVLLSLYYDSSETPFNIYEASTRIAEVTVRSRFIGREEDLLILRCPLRILGDKTLKILDRCCQSIAEFARNRLADLVVVVNTGQELLSEPGGAVTLDSIIQPMCDDTLQSSLRNTMLFMICCDVHGVPEFPALSRSFTSMFSFSAPLLNPVFISTHFVTTILDFGVIGRETLWQSLKRAAKAEVLNHTAVYMATNGSVYRVRTASMRHRPNGEDVTCCGQPPDFRYRFKNKVFYRCRQREVHRGSPYFTVDLLQEEEDKRWIFPGRDRYMIDKLL